MKRSKRTCWSVVAIALVGLCLAAAPAGAELANAGWGVRGGITVDPDQIFFGAHGQIGFLENFYFMPNATIGFGDDLTIFSINPDVVYAFPVEGIGQIYAGGLVAIQFIKFDEPSYVPPGFEFDDTDTEAGFHILGGVAFGSVPVFLEMNVGLDDTPDLKLAIGYTFGY